MKFQDDRKLTPEETILEETFSSGQNREYVINVMLYIKNIYVLKIIFSHYRVCDIY